MKDKKNNNFKKLSLNVIFWVVIIAIFSGIWVSQNIFSNKLKEVAISDVILRANKGEISKLEIQGNDVRITRKGEKRASEKSVKESGTIYEQGLENGNNLEFNSYDCASYCDCSFLYANYAFGNWSKFASNEFRQISSKTLR